MSSIHAILTHPGSAHKDEFLACSVLLALHPVPLLRREPTLEDLNNPALCVVDVGHRHEPALNNFDHHQFSRDHVPTCSLSLVLQHLGLYEDAREFCEWLEVAEWFDCRGPIATAQWMGVERSVLTRLNSPIDISMLRRFSQSERLEPGQPLWELLRMVGSDLLEYVNGLHERLAFLRKHAQVWTVELGAEQAKVLFIPRTEPMPEDPSFGLERFVDHEGLGQEIRAVVYPDRRSTGYGLSRFRDHPRFNFLRINTDPRVHFAHARGFMAKTTTADEAELRSLLQAAAEPAR
jgi:hypothetical protein